MAARRSSRACSTRWPKDRAAAEHNYYFDVASANLYFRTDNIYDLIAWHHQQMREHGFDKPLWLTETNAAPSTDPAWPVPNPTFPITLDEQAHFIIQVDGDGAGRWRESRGDL